MRKSLSQILSIINEIQKNKIYIKQLNCEPFFSKYNLVRGIRWEANKSEKDLFNICAYADKNSDENGLEIIVLENNRVPAVAHSIWYKVGSADEPNGKSGILIF